MDALAGYGSDEDDAPLLPSLSTINAVRSAPLDVTIMHNANRTNSRLASIDLKTNTLVVNSKVDIVLAPESGPHNPFKRSSNTASTSVGLGTIEATNVEDWSFDEQYQTFQKSGYAIDVDNRGIVGDYQEYVRNGGSVASYSKKETSMRASD